MSIKDFFNNFSINRNNKIYYNAVNECRERYEKERKLRDESLEKDAQRRLNEQREDFEKKIVEIEEKYKVKNEECERMKKKFKKAKESIDKSAFLVSHINGLFENLNNKVNIQFAQLRQPFLMIADEVETLSNKLNKNDFQELE